MTTDDKEMWRINIENDTDMACSMYGSETAESVFRRHGATCFDDLSPACDCVDCEFHTRNEVSLDDPLPDGEGTRGDYVPDDNPTPEEIISDRDLLERTCLGR